MSKANITIKVIGVGGGGSNAVENMYRKGLKEVESFICNTDIQALEDNTVPNKIQIGHKATEGLGAGNHAEKGALAANEDREILEKIVGDLTQMLFVTAGMGGGTGTGAAPIVAEIAKNKGILTVGVVTIPFKGEGNWRIQQAIKGIYNMQKRVDALLIVNNERLKEMYGSMTHSKAFAKADEVLSIAIQSIVNVINSKGYINVDFADIRSVLQSSGVALMGLAKASGEERVKRAIDHALVSPLLNNNNIEGAQKLLIYVLSGEKEVTIGELDEAREYSQEKIKKNSRVLIWGHGQDSSLHDEVCVIIIATSFAEQALTNFNIGENEAKSDIVSQLYTKSSSLTREEIAAINFASTDTELIERLYSEPAYLRRRIFVENEIDNSQHNLKKIKL